MKKIVIIKDCELAKLYKFGIDDTFDYWYWRNHNIFFKNDFYEKINIDGYDEEIFSNVELKLKEGGILKNNKIIIPKGEYDLIEYEDQYGEDFVKSWEIKVNGVILTNLCDMLDEKRMFYKKEIAETMYIKDLNK